MGHLTVLGVEAQGVEEIHHTLEEIHHTLAEDMRVIDSGKHRLCILQGTMTGKS